MYVYAYVHAYVCAYVCVQMLTQIRDDVTDIPNVQDGLTLYDTQTRGVPIVSATLLSEQERVEFGDLPQGRQLHEARVQPHTVSASRLHAV